MTQQAKTVDPLSVEMGLEAASLVKNDDFDGLAMVSSKYAKQILNLDDFEGSLNRLNKVTEEAIVIANNNIYYAQRREDMAFFALTARRSNQHPKDLSWVESHNLAVKDIERKLEETGLSIYDLNQAEVKAERDEKAKAKQQLEKEKKFLEIQAAREDREAKRQAEVREAEKTRNIEKHKQQNQVQKAAAAANQQASKSARRRARRKQK